MAIKTNFHLSIHSHDNSLLNQAPPLELRAIKNSVADIKGSHGH